jgi:hypothetical protein
LQIRPRQRCDVTEIGDGTENEMREERMYKNKKAERENRRRRRAWKEVVGTLKQTKK